MNIVIVKPGGDYYFRADSTLNHKFLDYYCPDAVERLAVVPVIYTRIKKTGKCVSDRFAQRYFDSFAFGCLINDTTGGVSPSMAVSLDATTVMGMDFSPIEDLPQSNFTLAVNDISVFKMGEVPGIECFTNALCAVTARSMLRMGDILALELAPPSAIGRGDTLILNTGSGSRSIKII
ncbi:MAG: hypothetical protein IJR25_08025 [Bacteroidales bacterium]|nr:hypothetical protein [Bacteroidales bacterium]MBQ9584250.1 hypothetical protein [Bacteroidales bacterium]